MYVGKSGPLGPEAAGTDKADLFKSKQYYRVPLKPAGLFVNGRAGT